MSIQQKVSDKLKYTMVDKINGMVVGAAAQVHHH